MDHIDRKIIDILQKDARSPLKEIADRVFLSSPAVSARIARLEKEGCLTGYQAQVTELQGTIQEQAGTIQTQQNTIAEKDSTIAQQEETIQTQTATIDSQAAAIEELEAAGTAETVKAELSAAYEEGVESNG